MFLLLTDKHGKKAVVNMDEIAEVSYDTQRHMTVVHYKRTFQAETNNGAVLPVRETPEEIWEMMGAMK
jgi:hypothetical protein